MMTITKKKIFRWAKVLILIYCVIGIAFYYWQDNLLFHPTPVDRKTDYAFSESYTEVNVPYDKETNLNIIQFRPAARSEEEAHDTAKGVVLYFHGNSENVRHYAPYASDFTHQGY